VIIVQLGGRPFNTAALTLEQWMWCILFGVGVLLWGQLITTIPTKRIPKQFSWGSGPPEEIIDATSSLVEDGSSGSLSQDVKRTGQILWIRGLTRLQTQVCLIQLHNSTVSQQLSLKRQSLGSPTSPTALAAATLAAAQGGASGIAQGLAAGAAAAAANTAAMQQHISSTSSSGDTAQLGQQTLQHHTQLPPQSTHPPHQYPPTIDEDEEGANSTVAPELPGGVSGSTDPPLTITSSHRESTQTHPLAESSSNHFDHSNDIPPPAGYEDASDPNLVNHHKQQGTTTSSSSSNKQQQQRQDSREASVVSNNNNEDNSEDVR